jgi:hypothetical protein
LQREAAPDGSRLRTAGRRCRRRGGAGAGAGNAKMVTAQIGSRRHAAHILYLFFSLPFNLLSSGSFGIWYI